MPADDDNNTREKITEFRARLLRRIAERRDKINRSNMNPESARRLLEQIAVLTQEIRKLRVAEEVFFRSKLLALDADINRAIG